ncbi:lasso peptide isopeptide bond-forming cyclase [Plectonema cf. radiosum LEGE 06105]|uniref:asparagine synthase (glutamine-hydrolyzing) n=1 Tax=Plectonema cf. radiosum LEGE 06105 TaxID=945769 RepID=A0A8J7F6X9_9CYAN|nr:lasso peptide isopeptide bond-forming cyclase [Plectonema radiosum]MBE9213099.1 lasso peptide isopeptide bond-forming cyclase [Plectonema cf. radiosum LEGE 06105]
MSGIVGIYYLDGRPLDRENLTKMVDILAHRGPDGADIWVDGCVGLGHRMLWTTPESLFEKLPLINQRGDLVITADARIDNREELIAALQINNRPADKIADSELILAAYEKWGEDCPQHLLGDFAFAIWDERKQVLFCARDHMGVKPLYYYQSDKFLVLASEIKALFCLPEVPRQLNELKVAHHLTLFFEDRVNTFYKDILRLAAAHSLTVNSRRLEVKCYWKLDPKREIKLNSHREYVEAFREIFTEAVRCRLRSAFPVGSTLSGGLDSSSITCTARMLLAESGRKPLHTFSAIFPNLPPDALQWIDERYFINAVQSLGGFEFHNIHADYLNPLVKPLWQDDEPVYSPNLYIHLALYESAQSNGVRVFLDGIDGDSTISHGWARLTELIYGGKWRTLRNEMKAASELSGISQQQLLWKYGFQTPIQEPALRLWQILQQNPKSTFTFNQIINDTFSQRIGLAQNIQSLTKEVPFLNFSARQIHSSGLNAGIHQYVQELADKVTASHCLEARYPFYDKRLIEFCVALPSSQKFRQGWTRIILRQAMRDILPPQVHSRTGKGRLSFNFQDKLLKYEQKTIERVFEEANQLNKYVNLSALHTAYHRYAAHPLQTQIKVDAIAVFCAVTLSQWLNQANLNT